LDSKEGFAQANRKIREAMRERGELRRRQQTEKRRMSLADGDGMTSDEGEESVSGAEAGEYEEARKAR
jgi:glycerol-3-phosphate O-acyltransferase/dihydroxyacetone phosphate acyltransferase